MKRGLKAVAAALACLAAHAPHAQGHAGCHSDTCRERVARKHCDQRHVRSCIRRATLTYRLNPTGGAWMVRVAYCESRFNPYAANPSGSFGLYQFLRSTWLTTRYANRDWTRAKWQALAAAELYRAGRSNEWSCT